MSGAKWGRRETLSRAAMSHCLCRIFEGVMAIFPKRCPLWRRMILRLCAAFSLHAAANRSKRGAKRHSEWRQQRNHSGCSERGELPALIPSLPLCPRWVNMNGRGPKTAAGCSMYVFSLMLLFTASSFGSELVKTHSDRQRALFLEQVSVSENKYKTAQDTTRDKLKVVLVSRHIALY